MWNYNFNINIIELFSMGNELIITTLLGIIAFWLIRYINRSDKRMDYFATKLNELSEHIMTIINKYETQNEKCNIHHKTIDDRFENHEKRISKLEEK